MPGLVEKIPTFELKSCNIDLDKITGLEWVCTSDQKFITWGHNKSFWGKYFPNLKIFSFITIELIKKIKSGFIWKQDRTIR